MDAWGAKLMLMGCVWSPHSAAADHSHTSLHSTSQLKRVHLKEAARSPTPAKFTSAAKEGHFQRPLDSQRCRQLAMDWTIESLMVGLELGLC